MRSNKPILTANPNPAPDSTIPSPQSQSLSRGYGSILPTSLIYIVLSTRGCSPWRPDAVMSTTRGANNPRHRGFKGPRERIGYREKMRYFSSHPTLSPRNAIPGSAMVLPLFTQGKPFARKTVKEGRKPSPRLTRTFPISFALPLSYPRPGAGMLTSFPFDRRVTLDEKQTTNFHNGIILSLRIDSPVFNCCSHGTFPHFSLQSSHLNICYYHQDLH